MMGEAQMSSEMIEAQGLTLEEYQRIVELLGRQPNLVELGIFGVMWSEHCSYKSSKVHLQRLPTSGERVIQGPGENAGIVDLGDGWCAVFKIESHNHPSFIEPYQGAATGVGGILRDIFTMGSRPVAVMNSLRFGSLMEPSNRAIMAGVVKGIGDYGNSFGVPTVGGEVYFAECYSKNPLVNAFALGIARKDHILYARADGAGNSVIYVGAKTGRDGIHGAVMASAEFDEQALEKRPTVQVGDPFMEKLLLEACLEAMRTGAIIGIQDMGAAGLTCSSCEMGSRSGTGVDINLDLVPKREEGMTAYEIMLSESQERMLLVVKNGREREVIDTFKKWDLDAIVIGSVNDSQMLTVRQNGQVVAEIPTELLTKSAPVYRRPLVLRGSDNNFRNNTNTPPTPFKHSTNLPQLFTQLLSSPNLCSREWIYQQYDHMVRTNTVTIMGTDAAVIRVKETRLSIAMTLDGNSRYSFLNPREGAKLAIAEAARNLICVGAQPLAITNCLNFGSPERPEVMWEFSETIDGMVEACQAFGTPVTGGNVSFYNETEARGIYPTPIIGMIGLVRNSEALTTPWFKQSGDIVVLLGETTADLGGSEFMAEMTGAVDGSVPRIDLSRELAVHRVCLEAMGTGIIKSAHDCSDGGLSVALAESCFSRHRNHGLGVEIDVEFRLVGVDESWLPIVFLFSESPSRVIVSVDPTNLEALLSLAQEHEVPSTVLGSVGKDRFRITMNGESMIDLDLCDIERAWRGGLAAKLDQ
jgi:phosphoribosylformylglycinamidine synthase